MAERETPHLARALGRVEGLLDHQNALIERMTQEAADDRRAMRETLTAQGEDLAAVKQTVAEMKPVTDRVQRWEYVGTGIILTVGALSSATTAALLLFRERIARAIEFFGG